MALAVTSRSNESTKINLAIKVVDDTKTIVIHISVGLHMLKNVNAWVIVTRFMLRQTVVKLFYTDLKKPIAMILVYAGFILRCFGARKIGLHFILKGRRVDEVNRANSVIRDVIQQSVRGNSEFSALFSYSHLQALEYYAARILILKLPILRDTELLEKGAIIFKFTETFIPMYHYLEIGLLSKYFRLIFEPSWAGYSTEELLVWTNYRPEIFVVLTPDEDDFKFLTDMNTNLIPVKQGAAEWVNPRMFYKSECTKKMYDVICIANFNPVKRVDRYIRAIVRVTRVKNDFRAALVCAPPGSARRETLATIEWASDKANISFFEKMSQPELNNLINQSKVNVLLSLKEGANKALSEGFFSGTPGILLSENIGVNRASINEHTGKIIPDSELEATLMWFSDHYDEYKPEKWANEYLTPVASTNKLAKTLEVIEVSEGRTWSIGLFPKVNQPELAYLSPEHDWLLDKRIELLNIFSRGAIEEKIVTFLEQLQNNIH